VPYNRQHNTPHKDNDCYSDRRYRKRERREGEDAVERGVGNIGVL